MSRQRDQERPIRAASAPFAVECPGCREPVGVGRDLVGRVAGCPRCHSAFVVPQPDGAQSDRRIAARREPVAFSDPPVPAARIRAGKAPPAATLAFHDPVKTVRSGNAEIEIRRLTAEEKRSRHARRNLLILLVGAALLVALVVVLGSRGR